MAGPIEDLKHAYDALRQAVSRKAQDPELTALNADCVKKFKSYDEALVPLKRAMAFAKKAKEATPKQKAKAKPAAAPAP